jgi:DNA-binding beta-propeller fold protein YncE
MSASLIPSAFAQSATSSTAATDAAHFIYAAQDDGMLHVYDVDAAHAEVRVIHVFACCGDVRGIAAAAPTHRVYVMYNRANQGHVASLDLVSGELLWDHVLHTPGVDRGDVTPDGSTLYLPTWEDDADSPYELVIDADTGTERARIPLVPRSHDTIVSLDGQRVFMETKSQTASMYVADTSSNQVVESITGYCCSGVLAPFAINGSATRVVNNVNGYPGIHVADVASGRVTAILPFASGYGGHGVAWTPDERQVWVNDGGLPEVHVFDMTATPPRELSPVPVSNVSHWLTFGLDGRFAYVAGRKGSGDRTDVIDAATYQRVGSIGPSEDLLEVDVEAGSVIAVGNQFGIGRVTPSSN